MFIGRKLITEDQKRLRQDQKKRQKVLGQLTNVLRRQADVDPVAETEVVAVITRQLPNQIICYGRMTPTTESLFRVLNADCGTVFRYSCWSRITTWEKGYFVRLKEFGKDYPSFLWIALIGFRTEIQEDNREVIPFSCR